MNSPPITARAKTIAYFFAALLLTGLMSAVPAANADVPTDGIFSDSTTPELPADQEQEGVELGVKFSPQQAGQVTALQYYQGEQAHGVTQATLWNSSGEVLARTSFEASTTPGWRTVALDAPVQLAAGETYVASYYAPQGGYVITTHAFDEAQKRDGFALPANAGVYKYGAAGGFPTQSWKSSNYFVDVVFTPSSAADEPTQQVDKPSEPANPTQNRPEPSPAPVPQPAPEPETAPAPQPAPEPETAPAPADGTVVLGRSFPSEATTGVPAGTSLSPYTGPCTIQTDNVVIDGKTVNCELRILAQNVTIKNSVINGSVRSDPYYFNGSFTITDSEVHAGANPITGIGDSNFVATRVEVTGGGRAINCYINCTVEDSLLLGGFTDNTGVHHMSAIRMGSGSIIKGNTIGCVAPTIPPDAGCSAALTGYGDFDVVQKNTIDGNLILADSGGYCSYGGSTAGKPYSAGVNNIKFTNNVWQKGESGKCGHWGPITSFDSNAPGNEWTNNLWDDGAAVAPAN